MRRRSPGRRAFLVLTVALVLMLAPACARERALIPDPEARALLDALEGPSAEAAREAIAKILASRDQRFAAVLVELIRASEVGLAPPPVGVEAAAALERLTGEALGSDWSAWVRWYAGSELEPPPGFVGFKGRLLGRIDPAFATLLRDEHPRRIRAEEIVWGGVAYEGIPALDHPPVVAGRDATHMHPDEPVFGVRIGQQARAYPLRILDWHELANDQLGGVAFALAYCTLCGSGIAYNARVPGHGRLDFGSSGLLMRSNKLMVDRATRTLWNQLTGEPVLGPLAAKPIRLTLLPSVVSRWGEWLAHHPDTTVLSLETGHERPYQPGAAYAGYFASPGTMFPVGRMRDELSEKARIFGIERQGVARAWSLASLLERRVLNDRVAGEPVVLVALGTPIWVDGESVRSGPARYEAGAEVRAYQRGAHAFRAGEGPGVLIDEQGGRWALEEPALVGPGGERLARTPGVLAYWFAWQGFYPRTELYDAERSSAGSTKEGIR
jgi:hypothetical protein